MNDIDLCLEVV